MLQLETKGSINPTLKWLYIIDESIWLNLMTSLKKEFLYLLIH